MIKIAIHSVPRSGSTWLGNIFNSHPEVQFRYQPLFSYAFKSYLTTSSEKKDIDEFFEKILASTDGFINQKEAIADGTVPSFGKAGIPKATCYKEVRYHHILENLVNQSPDLKLILLIRNPMAVIYSWKNAPKEFKTHLGWDFEKEWFQAPSKNENREEEYNGFAKWKEAALLYMKLAHQNTQRVKLITYDYLLKNTVKAAKELFDFSGLDYVLQTDEFINQSKQRNNMDAYSVFKTKKNDEMWQNLPEEIIAYIEQDLKGTALEQFLKG